jgi:hypothetical protein
MLSAPVKPEFGPTLGELVEPRLEVLPRRLRGFLIGVAIGFVVVAGALLITSAAPSADLNEGGVSFSFSYPGMSKAATPAGDFIAVQTLSDGRIANSLTVGPWRLPPYFGEISGLAPALTANYLRGFALRTPGFDLESAGRTRIDGYAGYDFSYRRDFDGMTYWGMVVFLTPHLHGDRQGVEISMLVEPALSGVKNPDDIGGAGPLYEPMQTFQISGD